MKIWLLVILLAGTAARMSVTVSSRDYFNASEYTGLHDIKAWVTAGNMVLDGANPYVESYILDFGPVWAWISAFPVAIAGFLGIGTFGASVLIKSILILADIAILLLLIGITRKLGKNPVLPAALFFLNPVSWIITGYNGQFDNVSMIPVLLLAYRMTGERDGGASEEIRSSRISGLLMGISAAVKHSSAPLYLFMTGMFSNRRKLLVSAVIALGVFILVFVPYALSDGAGSIVEDLFGQQQRILGTGWSWVLGLFGSIPSARILKFLWVACLVVTAILARKRNLGPLETFCLYYVSIVLFVPSFGRHYLIYPILFGVLAHPVITMVYSLSALVFLLSSSMFSGPLALGDSPMANWHIFFVLAAWWTYVILRGNRKLYSAQT